ncbi:serine hydrolase domain-containing protein [Caulobacter endophyticus]|uniref:serine hydrolase domain-containing protein n=1 Tax=Caulobacter endophyticus TaxID=2172652 RepID=UPI00240EA697|nr:serine hydrolase domain-containing protein [Caulobacter endophyticus]MDG2530718.1 serine hydrolase [Caulobacter endophyticus]
MRIRRWGAAGGGPLFSCVRTASLTKFLKTSQFTFRRRRWTGRRIAVVAAVSVVALGAATFGLSRCTRQPHAADEKTITAAATPVVLPLKPQDWRGEIDYRALDARIQAMMRDRSMTGLAVAVVEEGRLSFVKGYGMTAPDEGEQVGPDTVFRWASLSKTVAGSLSARLAQDGAFSLNDPLGKFHTSLRLPAGAQETLTIEQLLSQRTGLPRNAYDGWLEGGRAPKMIRQALGDVPPQCPPATCHTYQNLAFDTIREVVETATHRPYAEEVRQRLFLPLGMSSATIGMGELSDARHWARPSRYGRRLTLAEAYYLTPAAAGVNSNIVDLARWMQAQMGLAPAVLPAGVLEEIQRPRVNTGKPYGNSPLGRTLEKPGYGLAMRSFGYQGHRLAGHSGAVDGYRATMMFDPARKTGVVMLWNSESSLPFKLQAEVFDLYYHRPFTDWLELGKGQVQLEP